MTSELTAYTTVAELASGTGNTQLLRQQLATLEAAHVAANATAPSQGAGGTQKTSVTVANKQYQQQVASLKESSEVASKAPQPAISGISSAVLPLLRTLLQVPLVSNPSTPGGEGLPAEDEGVLSLPGTVGADAHPLLMELVAAQAIATDPVLKGAFDRYRQVLTLATAEMQRLKNGEAITGQHLTTPEPAAGSAQPQQPALSTHAALIESLHGAGKGGSSPTPTLLRDLALLDGNGGLQDITTLPTPNACTPLVGLPPAYQEALSVCYYRLRGLLATYLGLYAKHRVLSAALKDGLPPWEVCESKQLWQQPSLSDADRHPKDIDLEVGGCRCHLARESDSDGDDDTKVGLDSNETSRLSGASGKGIVAKPPAAPKPNSSQPAVNVVPVQTVQQVTPVHSIHTAPLYILFGSTTAGITVSQASVAIPHVDTTHFIINTMASPLPSQSTIGGDKAGRALAPKGAIPNTGDPPATTKSSKVPSKSPARPPPPIATNAKAQTSYALPMMAPSAAPPELIEQIEAATEDSAKAKALVSPRGARQRQQLNDAALGKGFGTGSDSEMQSGIEHSGLLAEAAVDADHQADGNKGVPPPAQQQQRAAPTATSGKLPAGPAPGADSSSLLSPPALKAALGPLPVPANTVAAPQVLARAFYESCLIKLPVAAASQPVRDKLIAASMGRWITMGSQLDLLVAAAVEGVLQAGATWESLDSQLGDRSQPQQVPQPAQPTGSKGKDSKLAAAPLPSTNLPNSNDSATLVAASLADKLGKLNQLLSLVGCQSPLLGSAPMNGTGDEGAAAAAPILAAALTALRGLQIPSSQPGPAIAKRLPMLLSCWSAAVSAASRSLPLYRGFGVAFLPSPVVEDGFGKSSTSNMLKKPFRVPAPMVRYDTDLLGVKYSSSVVAETSRVGGNGAASLLSQTTVGSSTEQVAPPPSAFTVSPNLTNCASLSACFDALREVDESLRREAALPNGRYAGGAGSGRGGGVYPPWELFSPERAATAADAQKAGKTASGQAAQRTLQQCILAALRSNVERASTVSLEATNGGVITPRQLQQQTRIVYWFRCNGPDSLDLILGSLREGKSVTVVVAIGLDGAGFASITQLVNALTHMRVAAARSSSAVTLLQIIFDVRDAVGHLPMIAGGPIMATVPMPTLKIVSPMPAEDPNAAYVAADLSSLGHLGSASDPSNVWQHVLRGSVSSTPRLYQSGACFWLHLAVWCDADGILLPPCKGGHCSSVYNEMLRIEEEIKQLQDGLCPIAKVVE